tara:strand:+ start:289 stop:1440 length:1152 start_codon:yes stop_codon:yes gene_type:complete
MIRLTKNTFYNEPEVKKELCEFIANSDRLSMGPKCKEFEEEFTKWQGRKYSVLYNSGSSANLALIQSLINLGRLKKGDGVGFSALTWATNVMPLVQLGLNPIPIDVSLENLNVNSKNLLEHSDSLEALFITNLLGFSGDLDKIRQSCNEKGILLIEDNCESIGSELGGVKLGNFGLASTFSFFVGHHLSTIEGGMVCTDDNELYEMLLIVRSHGWNRNLSEERKEELRKENNVENDFYDSFTFYFPGYNIRPTEITGFLGSRQMRYVDQICKVRNNNFHRFREVALQNPDINNIDSSHMSFVSNFTYPLIFKDKETMKKYLEKFSESVEVRPIEANMTEQPFLKNNTSKCPNAKKIFDNGFFFPNHTDLTEEEVESICNLLRK